MMCIPRAWRGGCPVLCRTIFFRSAVVTTGRGAIILLFLVFRDTGQREVSGGFVSGGEYYPCHTWQKCAVAVYAYT